MDDLVGGGTSALDGKFTVQQDEEQYAKLTEILDLLISAGYYRAKIQGLSAFDKIVGGMVWCISLCAEAVDVDLLYSENASIGQKIALTENIVRVLPKFKCPHAIEPHQIQGLDCIRIAPVIKWLVKEAIEAKKKHGDEILRFSAYQFQNSGWSLERDHSRPTLRPRPRPRPKRIFTRTGDLRTDTLEDDVRCTLLEYGLETEEVVMREKMNDEELGREKRKQNEAQFLENLKIAENLKSKLKNVEPTAKKVSARVVSEMIDSSRLGHVASESEGLRSVVKPREQSEQLARVNAELEARLSALQMEEVLKSEQVQQTGQQLDTIRERIQNHDRILAEIDPETLSEAKRLLADCKQIRTQEQSYKRECRAQMTDMEAEIDRLGSKSGERETSTHDSQVIREEISRFAEQLSQLNREVFHLSRRVDSKPTQIELNQYQRRFVELYNQVTAKHLEARRLCIYHNSLVDICTFLRKEITLLNNIDDQKNLALAKSYRASFMQNLEEIVRGINESLNKISSKKQDAQQRRDDLAHRLQELQDRKRNYHKAVAQFQEECQINEQLLAEEEEAAAQPTAESDA